MNITPSNFYKSIGSYEGYKEYVKKNILPDIESFIIEENISTRDTEIISNPGKIIEKMICEYVSEKRNRGSIIKSFEKKYIKGVNLSGFVKILNKLGSESITTKCISGIKCTNGVEIDMFYNNILIDIKSYARFSNTNKLGAFLQIIIYYGILKDEYNIKHLGIYVPTKNNFYYIKVENIDKHLIFFMDLFHKIQNIQIGKNNEIIIEDDYDEELIEKIDELDIKWEESFKIMSSLEEKINDYLSNNKKHNNEIEELKKIMSSNYNMEMISLVSRKNKEIEEFKKLFDINNIKQQYISYQTEINNLKQQCFNQQTEINNLKQQCINYQNEIKKNNGKKNFLSSILGL